MSTRLGRMIILVDDYDKALHFYTTNFFCKILYDAVHNDGNRYVHIGFANDDQVGIWLIKAESRAQIKRIGKQAEDRPAMAVFTDEIVSLYEHIKDNNVKIIGEFISTADYKYFNCLDLYGNKITFVEVINPKIK